ncbi:MAG: tetraacyldisaccharide 4'-kinase [Candidatus Aminicenantales bacterium]
MKFLIIVFSLFSRAVCRFKNFLYDRHVIEPQKPPLPVISVGNITFGGSEKTPLAMELIHFLLNQDFKPAFISRGYRGKWEKDGGILSDGKNILGTWTDSGDEPYMVARNFPQAGVFIGKRRILSCQKAKDLGFNIAVLDDGLQHRRLDRDLEIVLHNPREKWALREGPSALKRADILLLDGGEPTSGKLRRKIPSGVPLMEYRVTAKRLRRLENEEPAPLQDFRQKRVLAFCGIARPERFFSLLKKEGLEPVFHTKFPDHYPYSRRSLKKIAKKCKDLQIEAAVTTEKDAVRLLDRLDLLKDIPVYYLKIGLELEKSFTDKILLFLQAQPRKEKK